MTAVFKINTSKNFCFHCTPYRQGITGTGAQMFPDSFPIDRRKTVTKGIQFRHPRTFRCTKQRESKAQAVKGLPAQGRAGIFYRITFFFPSKLLRAFDRQRRSPTIPKPKGMKRCAEVGILLGFHWGTVSADFLLRGTRMWYHKSTNRRKRFISRKNVFLIVGKVPAEVVGRKPM